MRIQSVLILLLTEPGRKGVAGFLRRLVPPAAPSFGAEVRASALF